MTSKYSSIGEKVEAMMSLLKMNGKPGNTINILVKILDVSDREYNAFRKDVDIKVQLQDETLSELTLNVSYLGASGAEERIKPIKEYLPSHIGKKAYIFCSQGYRDVGGHSKIIQIIAPLESSTILVRGIERGSEFKLYDLGCKVMDYAQQKMPLLNRQ